MTDMNRKSVKLPETLHAYLATIALARKIDLQDLIADILREWAVDPAHAAEIDAMRAEATKGGEL